MSKTSVRKDIEKSVEEADDRDIFEKALETGAIAGAAPIVAGGLYGALDGWRLARRLKMKPKVARAQVLQSAGDVALIGAMPAPTMFMGGALYEHEKDKRAKERRKK